MRKRIGALGLAAVLLLAMICPALAADGKAELTLNGPMGAINAGDSFTVSVLIKDNPGFSSLELSVAFDSEVMKCTQVEVGPVLKDALSAANPTAKIGVKFAAASAYELTDDGVVAELSLTANVDIPALSMTLCNVVISNMQGDELQYTVSDISITGTSSPGETAETTPTDPHPSNDSEIQPNQQPEPALQPTQEDEPEPEHDSLPEVVSEPKSVQEITFTDTKGHWAESYISRAAELGLFKGYPDGSFKPDLNVTRAQYVTVLYRMAGNPAVTGEAPFTDIANQSQEFRTAIAWGYENGYLNGKGNGLFDPNGPVTRQEAMKILFGYDGGVSGMEAMFTAIYDQNFADSDQLASWGKAAMYWGVYNTIIAGTSETTLSPQGTATRAQLAKILTVYYDQQNNE